MPVRSETKRERGRRRARPARVLATLAGLGVVAACSSPAKKDRARGLARGNDAPELTGVVAQLAQVSSEARPSLVRILNETHTLKRFDRWADGLLGDLVGLFKLNPYYEYPYRVLHVPLYLLFGEFDLGSSLGSGFVVKSKDGRTLVVTNQHVVENAARLECELVDGRRTEAEVLVEDEGRDLALLALGKIEGTPPPPLRIRRAVGRPGEPVLAIGFPGRDVLTDEVIGLPKHDEQSEKPNPTVTLGIVSAVDVELGNAQTRYVQTDAAINHGGSGGPLLDVRGQVVGVVEMIGLNAANEGYAIPTSAIYDAFPTQLDVSVESSQSTAGGKGSPG